MENIPYVTEQISKLTTLIDELSSIHESLKAKDIHTYNNCATLLSQYRLELVTLKNIKELCSK